MFASHLFLPRLRLTPRYLDDFVMVDVKRKKGDVNKCLSIVGVENNGEGGGGKQVDQLIAKQALEPEGEAGPACSGFAFGFGEEVRVLVVLIF